MTSDQNYKILLIDDRKENLLAFSAVLKSAGYSSDCALSGKEGLSLLLKNQYGLIILDVQMPEISGFETAELIKGNSKTRDIPIIFLSAHAINDEFFRKGHEIGALDYLTKPVDEALLLLKVRNFLQLHDTNLRLAEANKELEKKAAQAEISYQDLYYSIPQDVILINQRGIVVNVNRTGIMLCGIHVIDIINKHFSQSKLLVKILGFDLDDFFNYPEKKRIEKFELEKFDNANFFGEALISIVQTEGELHVQVSINDISIAQMAENNLAREIRSTKKFQSMLLSSQINPHFTFNALNSVQYFILLKEDVESALNFVADFSLLMRDTLTNSRSEFIRVFDEVAFLELYLKLEQKRFDQKFEYSIAIAEGLNPDDLFIPPMLIQPYLENAVIHGIANSKKKGKIVIQILKKNNSMVCVIKDNGIGREKANQFKNLRTGNKKHQSLGMNITETRIKLLNELYGNAFTVTIKDLKSKYGDASGTQVEIMLPVLNSEFIFNMVSE